MDDDQTINPALEEEAASPAAEDQAPAEAAEAPAAPPPVAPPVMIHVRFSPDGMVVEISERPPSLSPQAWFNRLSERAGTSFQPLSGGRGLFRLPRAEIDALKTITAN